MKFKIYMSTSSSKNCVKSDDEWNKSEGKGIQEQFKTLKTSGPEPLKMVMKRWMTVKEVTCVTNHL